MTIIETILKKRGLTTAEDCRSFLNPDYAAKHDPFLLPDMDKAVERLTLARENQEHVVIYGDYDIDGLTATALLLDAFESFGFTDVDAFIPNRFVEGYGLTIDAMETIASSGAKLIVTVDCGSLSEKEIIRANELGVDMIITDHHNVAAVQPPAVAVINPKRLDHKYPFIDLAGVGVAFKLVQALQTRLEGLPEGQEKWLLDLVALGTVCDIVTLVGENRANVYWGLKVLSKTRRPGLKALMAVANIDPENVNARGLGFGLGPRMNAAGRLETARYSLDMLRASNSSEALEKAELLDEMNKKRRENQDEIMKEACVQAETMLQCDVLVVSHTNWNHGIIGIIAAKLLEKYKKPTYVLQELSNGEAKGSARSFGDFSVADAIKASDDIIIKGGGHKLAAGVTLKVEAIAAFRKRVNEYYRSLKLKNQQEALLVDEDICVDDLTDINELYIEDVKKMEPFGNGNEEPVIKLSIGTVTNVRKMGDENQHIKINIKDRNNKQITMIAFSAYNKFDCDAGEQVAVWLQPIMNEWRGIRNVEARLLRLQRV